MLVRKATMQDFEDILRLNKALFEYETAFNQEYNLDWTYSDIGKNYFKKTIEQGNALVADIEKHIIGYLVISINSFLFRKENPVAEIDNMFVEEDYRRQGIGTKLVKGARKIAKEKGAKRLKVGAIAQNEKAINFYKALGFSDFEVILQMEL